jgi:hypothetical protein
VAEDERVEGEASAGSQRGGDALEHASPLLPAVQVEQRAARDVDQRRRLLELEVAHIAEPELDWQPRRSLTCDLEHRRGRIDPEHRLPCLAYDLDRDAAAADH